MHGSLSHSQITHPLSNFNHFTSDSINLLELCSFRLIMEVRNGYTGNSHRTRGEKSCDLTNNKPWSELLPATQCDVINHQANHQSSLHLSNSRIVVVKLDIFYCT